MADEFSMSEEERLLREEIAGEVYSTEIAETRVEAAVKEEVEDTPTPTPEKPTPEEDPWEGVNPALRAAIENLTKKTADIDSLSFRVKQAESRVGGIDNRLRDLPKGAVGNTPSQQDVEAALASEEGMKEFLEDFPAHAKQLQARDAALRKTVEGIRAELQTDFDKKLNDIQLATELKILGLKYPNHKQVVEEPDFKDWLPKQTPEVQAQYSSWDALEGIKVLDKYFNDKPKPMEEESDDTPSIAEQRKERLEDHSGNFRASGKPRKQKTEAEMTEDELRSHYAKEIWSKK